MIPIWRDYYVDLGTGDVKSFSISTEGTTIFTGTAYRRPDRENIYVRINDICADYLRQNIPETREGLTVNPDIVRSFIVTGGASPIPVTFLYDWSYDETFNVGARQGRLSFPITGEVDIRQTILMTKLSNGAGIPYVLKYGDGTTYEGEFPFAGSEDVTLGASLASAPRADEIDTILLDGFYTYKVIRSCGDYVLYYVNEFGGWDSLLVKGTGIRTDNYNRFTHRKEYDNGVPTEAGKVSHLTEVTRNCELHTGWLFGDAGHRMHHLLSSPMVYLEDLRDNGVVPVLITDNECRYKDYHNNGGQLVDYTINVEVARDYRRL